MSQTIEISEAADLFQQFLTFLASKDSAEPKASAPKATTKQSTKKSAPKAPKVRRVRGTAKLSFAEKKVASLKSGQRFRIRPEGADYKATSVKLDKAHGFAVIGTDHPKAPSIKLRLEQLIHIA